jgi:hypothetical protein
MMLLHCDIAKSSKFRYVLKPIDFILRGKTKIKGDAWQTQSNLWTANL